MNRIGAASRLALLALTLATYADAAGDGRSVTLHVRCGDQNEKVRGLFAIEAAATLVDADANAVVEIDCSRERANIKVVDRLTNKTLARGLVLDPAAEEASSRIIAIGAAELLGASWEELALPHSSYVAPSDPAPVVQSRSLVRDSIHAVDSERALPRRSGSVLVGALIEASSTRGIAKGANARVWVDEGRLLTLGGEFRADTSTRTAALGDVSMTTLSLAVMAGVHRNVRSVPGLVGRLVLGFRAGPGWVSGESARTDVVASTVRGFSASAVLLANAEFPVGPLRAGLDWSLSHSVLSLAGNIASDSPVSTEGFAFGANLSVGIAW